MRRYLLIVLLAWLVAGCAAGYATTSTRSASSASTSVSAIRNHHDDNELVDGHLSGQRDVVPLPPVRGRRHRRRPALHARRSEPGGDRQPAADDLSAQLPSEARRAWRRVCRASRSR